MIKERIGYRLRPLKPQPPLPVSFSHLDLSQLNVPLPCLFIYPNSNPAVEFMPTNALLEGLKRAVDTHPILYGRLGYGISSMPEIQPSTEGVHIYTSEVAYPIASFDSSWGHATVCRGLGVPTWLVTQKHMLFGAKITRFANNTGVAIAVVQHHYCVDIYSFVRFIATWASFVRGEQPEPSLFDRSLLCGIPGNSLHNDLSSDGPRLGVILRISASKLQALKAAAINTLPITNDANDITWVSTANALGALLYRARLRAEQRPANAICHLSYPVNLRFLAPSLVPPNYFGNGLISATITGKTGDMLDRPIGYLAARLREAGNAITLATIPEKINDLAKLFVTWPPPRGTYQYILGTDCCYSDWTKFELQSLDFGYGHPICVRSPRTAQVSPTCLLQNMLPQQDGLEVYMVDSAVHLARMKQDKELHEYIEWIG
ncbi:transferase [Syncephalis fuscata]|nr:transferase [Syncephalis fuscata]